MAAPAALAVASAVITCFSYTNVIKENNYVRGDLTHAVNFLLARRFKLSNIYIVTDLDPTIESGSLKTMLDYMMNSNCFYQVNSIIEYTDTLIDLVSTKNIVFMYWSCHATQAGIVCPNKKGRLQVCPAKTLTNIILLGKVEKVLCIVDCCHASSVIDDSIFPPNVIKKDLIFVFSCMSDQNSGVMIERGASLFTYYCMQGLDSAGTLLFTDMNPTFEVISGYRDQRGKSEQTPIIKATKTRDKFFEWV